MTAAAPIFHLALAPAWDRARATEDAPGSGQSFPHVYGPLSVGAVVAAEPVPLAEDGRLDVGAVLPI